MMIPESNRTPDRTAAFPGRGARTVWNLIRLPILAVLTLLEPVVRTVVSLLIILGIFVTIVFEVSAVSAQFSLSTMIITIIALAAILVGYYALIALLSR
jgi:uncharacterized membrane protein